MKLVIFYLMFTVGFFIGLCLYTIAIWWWHPQIAGFYFLREMYTSFRNFQSENKQLRNDSW